MTESLELAIPRRRLNPGEHVSGTLVLRDRPVDPGARIALRFRERAQQQAWTEWETGMDVPEGAGPGGSVRFDLQLPADARPGYSSRHGELWWRLP